MDTKKIEGACHCGQVTWSYEAPLESATACNCSVCRRYGALWAYGYYGQEIKVTGSTQAYVRGKAIEFHFCPRCGCPAYYKGIRASENGLHKGAVNLRMSTDPQIVENLLIDHFDGLVDFVDLPRSGRKVRDLWF